MLTCYTIFFQIGLSEQSIIYNSELPVKIIHLEVNINEVYSFPL